MLIFALGIVAAYEVFTIRRFFKYPRRLAGKKFVKCGVAVRPPWLIIPFPNEQIATGVR